MFDFFKKSWWNVGRPRARLLQNCYKSLNTGPGFLTICYEFLTSAKKGLKKGIFSDNLPLTVENPTGTGQGGPGQDSQTGKAKEK